MATTKADKFKFCIVLLLSNISKYAAAKQSMPMAASGQESAQDIAINAAD